MYIYIYINYIYIYNMHIFSRHCPLHDFCQAGAPRDAPCAQGDGGRAPGARGGAELPRRAQRHGRLGRTAGAAEGGHGDILGGRKGGIGLFGGCFFRIFCWILGLIFGGIGCLGTDSDEVFMPLD